MTSMKTTNRVVLLVVLAAVACGGKQKKDADDVSTPLIDTQASSGDSTDHSANMVPPEKMDEINRLLARKQMIISRCLADAVDAGEAKKGTHAKVTLEISIDPSGQASKVNVLKSTTELQSIQSCVVEHVKSIAFPTLPKQYETSYTYAMEAN
jgi:hypothetical protein